MAQDKRLFLECFKFLEAEEVLSTARLVSRQWRQIALLDELWLTFLLRDVSPRFLSALAPYRNLRFAYYCLQRRHRFMYVVREREGSVVLVRVDLLLQSCSPLLELGCKHSLLLLSDESVVLCGGKSRLGGKSEQSSAICYLYRSQTNTMQQIESLSSPKNNVCLLEREGKVYGFGGWRWEIASMRRKYLESSSVDVWTVGKWGRESGEMPVSAAHLSVANLPTGVLLAPQQEPWTCYLYEPIKDLYSPFNLDLGLVPTHTFLARVSSDIVFFAWGDDISAVSLLSSEKYQVTGQFDPTSLETALEYHQICYIPHNSGSDRLEFTTLEGKQGSLEASCISIKEQQDR